MLGQCKLLLDAPMFVSQFEFIIFLFRDRVFKLNTKNVTLSGCDVSGCVIPSTNYI